MKWKLVAGVLLGVICAGTALADDDFGEDDFYEPQEQIIIVPERQRTTAAAVPAAEVKGVDELPWAVLDTDLDGDGDGLSDADEVRLVTDALNPDTDGDGYIDGLEVVRGYNPLEASPGDKVVFTEPDAASLGNVYKVTGVRLASEGLVVTGVGPPNTLVTLLVFSDQPKVWMARVDSTGRFKYASGEKLAMGEHKIYAAGTAAAGEVLAASVPVKFNSGQDAIEVVEPEREQSQSAARPQAVVADGESRRWYFIAAGVSSFSVAALVGVGLVLWRRRRVG